VDALASPLFLPIGVAAVALAVLGLVSRRYQRCPHCGRLVPRAHRGWLRCRLCGRQYHRSVNLGR
jgi:tRNA(Ile2) C34 agmatinyltransferase TiaS